MKVTLKNSFLLVLTSGVLLSSCVKQDLKSYLNPGGTLQFNSTINDNALYGATQRLNLITTELQEGVMKTRMQPIGNVWSKFPRLVRDLATMCGKEVRIEMEGKETELDKTIIEAIKDPLTHLVRNTVDHGIEKPEVRTTVGKPVEGCLTLKAYHEGGQVNIEIVDDGAGINIDRVKSKAIEKGLITAEQASKMPDREVGQLIFLPGFSTAEKVSNVSGRGVGMLVLGVGTDRRFALSIDQVTRLEKIDVAKIEHADHQEVVQYRGEILPLIRLSDTLGVESNCQDTSLIDVVVYSEESRSVGLVVDRIIDIVETELTNARPAHRPGLISSVVIDGHVTDLVDLPAVIRMIDPSFFESQ